MLCRDEGRGQERERMQTWALAQQRVECVQHRGRKDQDIAAIEAERAQDCEIPLDDDEERAQQRKRQANCLPPREALTEQQK